MTDLAGAFSAAQEAALRGSEDLRTAMGLDKIRLYSVVPVAGASKASPLPYVVIGDDQILTERTGVCGDEAEIFATVHVHTKGTAESASARAIAAAIKAALLVPLEMADVAVVDDWAMADERYSTDPDQSTHGVLTFHYLVSPET